MQIQDILTLAQENKASDIHISPGNPVMLRIDGDLEPFGEQKLMPNDIDEMLRPLMSNKELNHLEEVGELDFAFSVPGFSRIRANVFRQRGTFAAALRILSYDVPSAEVLGIPKSVIELTEKKRGLVLVTGATGSGKSTTLASLIEIIANRDRKNIITLEDPIEYLHTNKKAIVCQREIGCDTLSYTNALRAALRQDPDVILLGEMRDADTITTAITAAETGHLVFSTLHTNNSSDAIDRILGSVDPEKQQQIRLQFSSVLEGVVAQQLMPRCDRDGRVAAFEVLLATPAVRNLIRESKTMQIPSIIQTSKKEGMQTMDDCILSLYFQNMISEKTAIEYAFDEDYVKSKLF
ncbi:MAG: type IV pilus twitching motility protein PilT [Lachnospiraceae bacterium]|nr:type IV pilus twitching motility protein PilT [Lachnospiraceae bacterium]